MSEKIVIDAKDGVLGRVASHAAKEALRGNTVTVVNCNDAIVVGEKGDVISQYKALLAKGGSSQKGPKMPRIPERIMKRTIRGMLPHFQKRGEDAEKRVMCYNEVPKEFESAKKITIVKKIVTSSIKLSELVKLI